MFEGFELLPRPNALKAGARVERPVLSCELPNIDGGGAPAGVKLAVVFTVGGGPAGVVEGNWILLEERGGVEGGVLDGTWNVDMLLD